MAAKSIRSSPISAKSPGIPGRFTCPGQSHWDRLRPTTASPMVQGHKPKALQADWVSFELKNSHRASGNSAVTNPTQGSEPTINPRPNPLWRGPDTRVNYDRAGDRTGARCAVAGFGGEALYLLELRRPLRNGPGQSAPRKGFLRSPGRVIGQAVNRRSVSGPSPRAVGVGL